ncbi:phage terminase large subunit family protein [Deefgea piscis]|uniref:Phage terminase large subunit family protein n=1 Tax=Deefgea piscis TaxID=2739061 RepID=A0A6M8STM7_9NEIS|nr:phage terminase large subunit family protein [Deefgea piscis]QKJ67474.1 phage terminase large subunit family protein [Deefgea piscis]
MQTANAFNLAYRAARRAVRPKQFITVSEWADQNRKLSSEGSAEHGEWKTSRTPYLREIMDALSEDSPVREVWFQKSSQVGGTEAGSNWLGYIMAHAKGPVGVIMPTEKALKDWFSQKFDPMAEQTPAVRDVLASRSNKGGDNSAERKKFVGGILYAKTAGSTTDLKSTSLRYALADEVDEYDWSTLQGDPVELLKVRLTTFHDRKMFGVSSPTIKDASKIEEKFEGGDQRRYMLACPHCGERQYLRWGQVQWRRLGEYVRQAWYVCEHNGCIIEEHEKTAMLAGGVWQAHNPSAPYRSYHINAIYSPVGLGLSWVELANEWIAAQGLPEKLMVFMNTRLGETWADRSHDLKPNTLLARAEPYDLRTIPIGCVALTAGVDTQDDRLEIQIRGWGRDSKSWVIDYHILYGNPAEESLWDSLAEYLNGAEFVNAWGKIMRLEASAIDTGGHHTHMVYQFVRSQRVRRPMAIKGANTTGRAILSKPTQQDVNWKGQTIKKGVQLYTVGGDTAKHWLYARLNADTDKPADARLEHFSHELEAKWYDGLVSEAFNPKKNRWEIKKGKRNEPLDTAVYALAASHHPELHIHKWKQFDWDKREAMLQPAHVVPVEVPLDKPDPAAALIAPLAPLPPAKPKQQQRPRRQGGYAKNW